MPPRELEVWGAVAPTMEMKFSQYQTPYFLSRSDNIMLSHLAFVVHVAKWQGQKITCWKYAAHIYTVYHTACCQALEKSFLASDDLGNLIKTCDMCLTVPSDSLENLIKIYFLCRLTIEKSFLASDGLGNLIRSCWLIFCNYTNVGTW